MSLCEHVRQLRGSVPAMVQRSASYSSQSLDASRKMAPRWFAARRRMVGEDGRPILVASRPRRARIGQPAAAAPRGSP